MKTTSTPQGHTLNLSAGAPQRSVAQGTLTASELRYRRLFETARDGILILDAETGAVVDVNPFLLEMLGYSYEQFVGKAIWELGFLKDAIASRDKFLELQQHEYIRYENLPLETADGRCREVEFVSNVYLVNQKKVIQCNIRDITERKRAEAELRESEERFRILFEQAADSILLLEITPEGVPVIRDANGATFRSLGYERAELIGQPVSCIDADPGASKAVATKRDDIRSGHGGMFAVRRRCKNGTVRDFECSVSEPQIGAKTFAISVERDVTARKQAEEEHARLVTAVEQSAETIVITDASATILYANPAFEKTTGYARAEAIGQNPRILASGRQDAQFYRRMWSVLTSGQVWIGHFINKRKDGRLYEEEASISPVRDAAGTIVNYVAVKRDVTHEAELEAQLRQAQKMEAVGRLAGGVAHDFNNMLQTILGTTELLLNATAKDDPRAADLREILAAGRRSADLTRQLLAFARKQTIAPKVIDLNDAVAGMFKMLMRLIGEDIELSWKPAAALRPVKIDPSQLDQILANLAVNARDAIAGAGKVTLETRNVTIDAGYCEGHTDAAPGAYVLLAVSDNGCGMDQETQARIFEPFFTTKPTGEGTGLGLATVYGIVRQNNGFIHVYSEPGKGTTFRIYLPQHASPATGAEAASEPGATPTGTETVLLVEDEVPLLQLSRRLLEGLGYAVLAAAGPAEAMRLAAAHAGDIHLLLTDVVMPGHDGWQLASQIGAAKPGIKVLFMSGYTADVIAQRGVLEQSTAFIAKPFTRVELACKVRSVLDAREPAKPEARTPRAGE